MAHSGDHRDGAAGDGAGHGFFVEGPEVFERSAAAGHDHQLGPGVAAEVIDPTANLLHRAIALHQSGEEPNVETREAAGQDLDHVGDDGAARRGGDADALGVARERALAGRIEEALFGQFLLELLEGELERAVAQGLQEFDDELVFAARLEDVDAAAREHGETVLGLEFPIAVRGAEGHYAHLRLGLLQGEVVVAAGSQLDAGYFAGDPDVGEVALEGGADGGVQLADGVDAAGGGEVEGELVHYSMVAWGGLLNTRVQV